MSRFRAAITLLLLLLCLGCREERAVAPVSKAVDDNKPQDGGTLVRRLEADISTLNPITVTTSYDDYVNLYLFEPLLQYSQSLEVIPGIAEKWEVSSDG